MMDYETLYSYSYSYYCVNIKANIYFTCMFDNLLNDLNGVQAFNNTPVNKPMLA